MLDAELTTHHVQDLSDAEAVVGFFGLLGYDTEKRIAQSPAALGITESLHPQIRRCELLADQDGFLQVYLFELKSVTQAAINGLARAFRNRVEQFLLVLTSDYQRLDFVLLERVAPEEKLGGTKGPTQKQVTIHPRALRVQRRKPERADLRVLRRLTYTEADALAQFDKLLSAFTVAEWTEEHFNSPSTPLPKCSGRTSPAAPPPSPPRPSSPASATTTKPASPSSCPSRSSSPGRTGRSTRWCIGCMG